MASHNMLEIARALYTFKTTDFPDLVEESTPTVFKAFLCAVSLSRSNISKIGTNVLGSRVASIMTSVPFASELCHHSIDETMPLRRMLRWDSEVWTSAARMIETPFDADPRNFVDGSRLMKRREEVSYFIDFHQDLQAKHPHIYELCCGELQHVPMLLWTMQKAHHQRIASVLEALWPDMQQRSREELLSDISAFHAQCDEDAFENQYTVLLKDAGVNTTGLPPLEPTAWRDLIQERIRMQYGEAVRNEEPKMPKLVTQPLCVSQMDKHPLDKMLDAFACNIKARLVSNETRTELLFAIGGLTNAHEAYQTLFGKQTDAASTNFHNMVTSNEAKGVWLHNNSLWAHFLKRCIEPSRRKIKHHHELHESALANQINHFYIHLTQGEQADCQNRLDVGADAPNFEVRVQMWLTYHSVGMAQALPKLFSVRMSSTAQRGIAAYRKEQEYADIDALKCLAQMYF